MSEELKTVVIDNGAGYIKAGMAGNEYPSSVLPTVIGHSKFMDPKNVTRRNQVIGEEAIARVGSLKLEHPINHGIVQNWDDMVTIWDYLFKNELRVDPSDISVLITDTSQTPRRNREEMIKIMFETFNVQNFYVQDQSKCSLFATGRTTGVVLQIGEDVSIASPIDDGNMIPHAYQKVNIGGHDIDEFLMRILTESGYFLSTSEEKEMTRDIKEKYGYVALDYNSELQKSSEIDVSYETPQGKTLKISSQRFRCAELLFKPTIFLSREEEGVDVMLYNSIIKTEEDIQKDLYANIIVSGGSTMFQGFPERISQEIERLENNPYLRIKVIAIPDRKNLSWMGGSTIGSFATFPQMVISREDYDDAGPGIVHRRCF